MKPRLTAKVVRGLRDLASLARADLDNGALSPEDGWADDGSKDDAETALLWIYRLCTWHEEKKKGAK